MSFFSGAIIIWGVIIYAFQFFKNELSKNSSSEKAVQRSYIRTFLASYIFLSLEVLIAADLIDTIAHPELNEIITVIVIVFIRTFISYFLQKEIKETTRQGQNFISAQIKKQSASEFESLSTLLLGNFLLFLFNSEVYKFKFIFLIDKKGTVLQFLTATVPLYLYFLIINVNQNTTFNVTPALYSS